MKIFKASTKRERATSARRLLKLADFLDTVPKEQFDFSIWTNTIARTGRALGECGTAGCALGWATAIPSFRKLGLRLFNGLPIMAPEMRDTGVQAAERLFLLSYSEAHALFVSGYGLPILEGLESTPKAVGNRIRKFVKEHRSPTSD